MKSKNRNSLDFIKIKKLLIILIICNQSFSQQEVNKTGMLILGSANEETLIKRVEVGFNLYQSEVNFDYIIVAGGCGAHASSICEAEEMKIILLKMGVPEGIIYKEDKSKTSAQNYCYSKKLKKPNGTKIINKNDELYVVSNHWHAISVAGCFSERDVQKAVYHIEGGIKPKETDMTDYVNIFRNCNTNENYCKVMLWPFVNAAYYMENESVNEIYYFTEDIVHRNSSFKFENVVHSGSYFNPSDMPVKWTQKIDAAFYNTIENKVYYFKEDQYLKFTPNTDKIDKGYPRFIKDLVKNIPDNWNGGNIDAAFFNPLDREVFLFKGEEYVKFTEGESRLMESPQKISELIAQWPFQWAQGNIDAAYFIPEAQDFVLFRGQEYLKGSLEVKLKPSKNTPKKIELTWPKEMWGVNFLIR